MKAKMLITAATLAIATMFTGCADDLEDALNESFNTTSASPLKYSASGDWKGKFGVDGAAAEALLELDYSHDDTTGYSLSADYEGVSVLNQEGSWTSTETTVLLMASTGGVIELNYIEADPCTLKTADESIVLIEQSIY